MFNVSNFPWITSVTSFLSLGIFFLPGAAETLQYFLPAITQGEWWRSITGHLTHWTISHLFWDVAAFAILGAFAERISRRRFLVTISTSALAISGYLYFLAPDMQTYRGLSGIDSGLFTFVAIALISEAWRRRDHLLTAIYGLCLAGFTGKVVIIETLLGQTAFADMGPGVVALPAAHIIGGALGLLAAAGCKGSSQIHMQPDDFLGVSSDTTRRPSHHPSPC